MPATRHFHNWSVVSSDVNSKMDTLVMALYFLSVLSLGLWVLVSSNRATIRDFFLAGRNLAWWAIGMSLFATDIGSSHFMGLAGIGASSGIAVGTFHWNAIFMVFVLGWIYVPIYINAGVVTFPEYLRKRFGSFRIQFFISILFLIIYTLSKISLEICYCAMFLKIIWKMNIYQTTLALLMIIGMFTITGGLTALVYTEVLHACSMLLGSVLLVGFAFNEVGGYQGLVRKYFWAIPRVTSKGNWTAKPECYMPRSDAFHIFRDPVSGDLPWPGITFGATTVSLFLGCDEIFIQRCLAGKDLSHMKGGCLLWGYLKLLPMFLMVMPGMISRILLPDQVACVVPSECEKFCGVKSTCKPIAYPALVISVLPSGLHGLMLTTLCAAAMSSLTSVFNSASAVFTMNIYTSLRPMATEKELMVTGRFFVIALLAVTVVWVPIIETAHSENLFEYMQVVKGYLTPPITAVALLAVFCRKVTEKGAFWGLTFGMTIGFIRLLTELAYGLQTCERRSKCPALICGLHYLYFSMILLLVSLLSMMGISLITDPIPDKHLHGLCWSLRNSQEKREDLDSEIQWSRFPSLPAKPDKAKNAQTCLWTTWDVFCGLDPQPHPKLASRKAIKKKEVTEKKVKDTEEKLEVTEENVEVTKKMEVTEEKVEVTEEKVEVTEKIEVTKEKLEVTEEKLAVTEEKLAVTEEKLAVTEEKLEVTEEKLAVTEEKLEVTEEKLAVTEEKLEHSDTSAGAEVLAPRGAPCKMKETDEETQGTKRDGTWRKRLWSRVVSVSGVILAGLVVLSHMYFA